MNVEHPPAMHHKRYQDILPRPKALRAGRTSNIERRIMISLRYLAPERKAYSGAVLNFDELVKSPKNVMPDPVSGTGQARYGIRPVYNLVDTCAAEFKASTPYYYSTYETESEARVSAKKKVIILGGGSNRIGQGG